MGEDGAGILARPLALENVAMRRGVAAKPDQTGALDRRVARRSAGAGWTIAAVLCLCAQPAAAYRPFDGTDAAVADVGETEIELQPFGYQKTGSSSAAIAPFVVYNYGFADRWEMVLQTEMLSPITGGGQPSIQATGAFLKYVIVPGALQEKSGVSVATEFGFLLPGINADPGVGFSWAGIVSQRWDWGTAHFNVEANLTRDHEAEAFVGVILEGPHDWKVRPVFETFYDKIWTQTESRSVLIGAIWQVNHDLALDVAYRYALVNGSPVNEIRAGLTFAFKDEHDTTPMKPGATFSNWGLSR
jgi:hypothetical protein